MLAGHLHFIPESRVRMIARGGDVRFIGWGVQAEIAADRYDQLQAIVAGFGGKEVGAESLYPRPGAKQSDKTPEAYAPTIADFSVGMFMNEINK